MRIRDKRSYFVHVARSSPNPVTLYLLDTAGKTVRSISVPPAGASVTVPVGQTAEVAIKGGQKPGVTTVNGAEATVGPAPVAIGHSGYILTSHPRAGDIVEFM